MSTKTFEVEVQTDSDTNESFFEIPPELLKNLGWKMHMRRFKVGRN